MSQTGTVMKLQESPDSPSLSLSEVKLYDSRVDISPEQRLSHPPMLYFAHGYAEKYNLNKFLRNRPLIILSDWQFDPPTQRHVWEQVVTHLRDEEKLSPARLSNALILIAGDMASKDNTLRGVSSDAAPDLSWLVGSLGELLRNDDNSDREESESVVENNIEIYFIYGNHCCMAEEHLEMRNRNGKHCLLKHGKVNRIGVGNSDAKQPVPQSIQLVENKQHENESPSKATTETPPSKESVTDANETSRNEGVQSPSPDLSSMTKAERAEYYKKLRESKPEGFAKKQPKLSKLEVQEKQWRDQNNVQAELVRQFYSGINSRPDMPDSLCEETKSPHILIGSVHGIPSSHTQGLQKLEREDYFKAIEAVTTKCETQIDILVTHSNPCLPGQEADVKGEDAKRLYEAFLESGAKLHVHGHQHLPSVISVEQNESGEEKLVVNADCRVVVFV